MIILKKHSNLNFIKSNKGIVLALLSLLFLLPSGPANAQDIFPSNKINIAEIIWSKQKSKIWYDQLSWLSGCNYQPSTAINQIEMWQYPDEENKRDPVPSLSYESQPWVRVVYPMLILHSNSHQRKQI